MKKLFALLVTASMFGGLYGLSLGLGVAYDGLAGPDGMDAYPSIRADAMVNVLPMLGVRMGLAQVDIKDDLQGGTLMEFGTGVNVDLIINIPMAGTFNPYIPAGVWFFSNGGTTIVLKGGLGAQMGFGGVMGYLEGGINFTNYSPEVGEGTSMHPLYVQAGVRIPIQL